MFSKMPFILAAMIVAIVIFGPHIPLSFKEFLYAISLTIKSTIILTLPLIIFSLLFKATVTLSHGAGRIIGLIIALVCVSSFVSVFISHYVGVWVYHFDISMITPHDTSGLKTLWNLELPKLIANDKAMFSGLLMGLTASRFWPQQSLAIANQIGGVIQIIFRGFVYIIPLFVAGFVVKLQTDGVIGVIVRDYTSIFAIIATAQFSYIFLMYFLLNKCSLKISLHNIKNMMPAAMSGFTTMSSAASMPLTIIGSENITQNKEIARSVVPATVNIHLVGDCFATPIFAYAVLKSFGMPDPTLVQYLYFTFYFVLAKFSVAAIPGGGIIVMLPILESYLGFTPEMMSLITALYILFDPVITSANVLGNGAFVKMMDNLCSYLKLSGSTKRKASSGALIIMICCSVHMMGGVLC